MSSPIPLFSDFNFVEDNSENVEINIGAQAHFDDTHVNQLFVKQDTWGLADDPSCFNSEIYFNIDDEDELAGITNTVNPLDMSPNVYITGEFMKKRTWKLKGEEITIESVEKDIDTVYLKTFPTDNETPVCKSPIEILKNGIKVLKPSSNVLKSDQSLRSKIVLDNTIHRFYPKPTFSYSCMIALSLKNSHTGSLPVAEIYNFMCKHFPYFKTAPSCWKNSVRHNLSLNKCFEKIKKPVKPNQKKGCCLWTLNVCKIHKLNDEIAKCILKDEIAIKNAMECPENLTFLVKGEMKILKRYYSNGHIEDGPDDDEDDKNYNYEAYDDDDDDDDVYTGVDGEEEIGIFNRRNGIDETDLKMVPLFHYRVEQLEKAYGSPQMKNGCAKRDNKRKSIEFEQLN